MRKYPKMKATLISDNVPHGELEGEWGLSIYIEYGDKNILLDNGGSNLFLKNADALGLDISKIDYSVLSHAHYDHSLGTEGFFQANSRAKFYVAKSTGAVCYSQEEDGMEYIGVPGEVFEKYSNRIEHVDGNFSPSPGVWIIPHSTPGLSKFGEENNMFVVKGEAKGSAFADGGSADNLPMEFDDFSHEQSLVFETEKGLVIFNSCSHGGAENIVNEVKKVLPKRDIYAYIGGLHLYEKTPVQVKEAANMLKGLGVETTYTGHCTGEQACEILRAEMGDKVKVFHVGMVIEV